MMIAVCSAWRYKSTKDIVTFKNMPIADLSDMLWLVVPEEDKEYHKFKNIVYVPKGKIGYSIAIDTFIDFARSKGENHVLFLDDDLRLCVRRIDNPDIYRLAAKKENRNIADLRQALGMSSDDYWRYVKAEPNSILKLFRIIDKLLTKGYAQVSISNRLNNNRYPYKYRYNCRAMQAWALNLDVLKKLRYKFSDMQTKQDMDCTLTLLEHGYTTAQICHWLVDGRASNAKGGVSVYRTPEVMTKMARRLARRHPGIVDIVFKKTKWRGVDKGHYDVRCSWLKARQIGAIRFPERQNLDLDVMKAL